MKKIKAFLLAAFVISFAGYAHAQQFTFPFATQAEREKAAELLARDTDFINLLVLNVFQSKLGPEAKAVTKNNMTRENGMTSENGMIRDNGMEGKKTQDAPAKSPVEMKNEPVAGMVNDGLTVPKGEKPAPSVAINDPSVENVDFFISLSCIHCKDFWKKIIQDDIIKQHLVNDKINIRIIPNSTVEAGIIVIFETLKEKDPAAARDFLTWYFTGGRDADEKVMFRNAEKWLAEHNYPGLKDIHSNTELLKRIGDRVEANITLDQKYDASYPSVYVNGKEDSEYFNKARDYIVKQLEK